MTPPGACKKCGCVSFRVAQIHTTTETWELFMIGDEEHASVLPPFKSTLQIESTCMGCGNTRTFTEDMTPKE